MAASAPTPPLPSPPPDKPGWSQVPRAVPLKDKTIPQNFALSRLAFALVRLGEVNRALEQDPGNHDLRFFQDIARRSCCSLFWDCMDLGITKEAMTLLDQKPQPTPN